MKKFTKILAVVLAFLTVLSVFASSNAFAARNSNPKTTNVHITKLQSDNYPKGAINHDGTQKTLDKLTQDLGTTVKPLAGVTFKYYKVGDQSKFNDMISNPKNYDTATKVEASGLTLAGTTNATGENGQTSVTLEDGYYWFVEDTKPDTVSSAVAVPFGLGLPLTSPDGTKELDDVYVYPKNVNADNPTPDKTVGNETNHATEQYAIGQEISWFLQTTVPTNIKDYVKLDFEDTLDTKLTYVANQTVEVTYGGETVPAEYYTVIAPTTTEGGNFKVSFKTNSEGKLDYFASLTQEKIRENAAANKKLVVKFATKINKNAVMGQEIQNTFDLKFRNNPNLTSDKTEKPTTPPKVVTGGKKFKKTDGSNGLKDAEFIIQNIVGGKTTFLKQDDSGQATWVEDKTSATVFKSTVDGTFEVKGLAYTNSQQAGQTVTNSYALVETKAPEGYALLVDPVAFTVDANSYSDQASSVQEVKNTKLTIPQTGGVGTVIYGVVGLVVMAAAVFAMRRRNEK